MIAQSVVHISECCTFLNVLVIWTYTGVPFCLVSCIFYLSYYFSGFIFLFEFTLATDRSKAVVLVQF